MQSTTIRVSRVALEMLEAYKKRINARSLDEAIRRLLIEYRRALAENYFGIDKGKVSSFPGEDRLKDREL